MFYEFFSARVSMSESTFTRLMDDLVDMSRDDPELAEGIRWIDEQAQRRGISFYDVAFEVLYRHDQVKNTSAWLERRN